MNRQWGRSQHLLHNMKYFMEKKTMQSRKLRSNVGKDGILHLDIPIGVTDKEIEVMVIYQPVEPPTQTKTPEELGWPAGFFEQTAGSLQDDPMVR